MRISDACIPDNQELNGYAGLDTDGEGNKRASYKLVVELLQSLIKGTYITTNIHLLFVP
jgi:hypothetical protein